MNFRFLSFVAIMALFASCAYFNIFYNAQKYYEEGVRPLQSGGSVNKQLLEKSIEKSSKILQFHPKSEYVDDALLLIGKAYMYNGEYTKAVRKFNELMEYFPNSKHADDALFYMGRTYMMQGENEVAKTILQQVVYRQGDLKIEAAGYVIEILIEKLAFTEAEEFIRSLSDRDKKNNTIMFLSGKVKWKSNKNEEALAFLEKVKPSKLQKKNGFEYYKILTDIYIVKKDLKKAEKALEDGLKIFYNHEMKNSFYLLKAKIFIEQKEHQKAVDVLTYALAQPLYAGKDSLLFLRGEIFETHISDINKALESYKLIFETNRNSELFYQAEIKVRSLEIYLSLTGDSVSGDDEENIKNRFLLAEINYLNLKRIDDSILKYKAIADSFPESVYSPKSLFALVYIYYNEKKDTSAALDYLREIMRRYPQTEYSYTAEEKMKELGFYGDTVR